MPGLLTWQSGPHVPSPLKLQLESLPAQHPPHAELTKMLTWQIERLGIHCGPLSAKHPFPGGTKRRYSLKVQPKDNPES